LKNLITKLQDILHDDPKVIDVFKRLDRKFFVNYEVPVDREESSNIRLLVDTAAG
jgi:hypothetical protein